LFLVSALVRPSHAVGIAVAPKADYILNFTATASTITVSPGAIYEVTMTTGASGEFIAFYDTVTTSGGTAITTGQDNGHNLKIKLFYGSTTANTQWRFDPPLLFTNGMQLIDSTGAGAATVSYEEGRGLSGQ
jgi:hypothetical protein